MSVTKSAIYRDTGDTSVRQPGPGRPKDLAKRAAILEAAKTLFIHHGYEGVSMDQIAASANVSKLTVYSHFGDKDALFVEAARLYCERIIPEIFFEQSPTKALREQLLEIATVYLGMVTTPQALSGHRLLCSPQMIEKRLSRLFWEAGPTRCQQAMAQWLDRQAAIGVLRVEDSMRAAGHFFSLIRGELHMRLLFDCDPASIDEQLFHTHVESAVDLFLRAHAI